jgi:inner membrane protein
VVIAVFAGAGRSARGAARAVLERAFPGFRTVDAVLAPLPSNPFCWSLIGVQVDAESGAFALRQGVIAPWPQTFAAARCPRGLTGTRAEASAPLREIAFEDARVVWRGQFVAPLAELRRLNAVQCEAAAFLRFARAPFWVAEGEATLLGDLRFDRGGSGRDRFAQLMIESPSGRCPERVPPWVPPLQELL